MNQNKEQKSGIEPWYRLVRSLGFIKTGPGKEFTDLIKREIEQCIKDIKEGKTSCSYNPIERATKNLEYLNNSPDFNWKEEREEILVNLTRKEYIIPLFECNEKTHKMNYYYNAHISVDDGGIAEQDLTDIEKLLIKKYYEDRKGDLIRFIAPNYDNSATFLDILMEGKRIEGRISYGNPSLEWQLLKESRTHYQIEGAIPYPICIVQLDTTPLKIIRRGHKWGSEGYQNKENKEGMRYDGNGYDQEMIQRVRLELEKSIEWVVGRGGVSSYKWGIFGSIGIITPTMCAKIERLISEKAEGVEK